MNSVLQCSGLTKGYDGRPVVDAVSLELGAGEIVALVGLNGAGKTTLMRLMLAMTRPDAGSVQIFEQDVQLAGRDSWARVGQMIETPFAYPELTVRENLWAAAVLHGVPRAKAQAAADDIADRLGLGPWLTRRARTLSLGNRQRVGLASALVHEPKLLILDEPSNALDPAGVVLLRDLVQEMARGGAAVLLSSHHLDEMARVADRVSVLHHGMIVGELDPHGIDLERAFFAMVYETDLARSEKAS